MSRRKPTVGDLMDRLWPVSPNPYVCLCGAYREDTCECGQWKRQREAREKNV